MGDAATVSVLAASPGRLFRAVRELERSIRQADGPTCLAFRPVPASILASASPTEFAFEMRGTRNLGNPPSVPIETPSSRASSAIASGSVRAEIEMSLSRASARGLKAISVAATTQVQLHELRETMDCTVAIADEQGS